MKTIKPALVLLLGALPLATVFGADAPTFHILKRGTKRYHGEKVGEEYFRVCNSGEMLKREASDQLLPSAEVCNPSKLPVITAREGKFLAFELATRKLAVEADGRTNVIVVNEEAARVLARVAAAKEVPAIPVQTKDGVPFKVDGAALASRVK